MKKYKFDQFEKLKTAIRGRSRVSMTESPTQIVGDGRETVRPPRMQGLPRVAHRFFTIKCKFGLQDYIMLNHVSL